MLISPDINLLAVFLAALVGVSLNLAWYSPLLFLTPWLESVGISRSQYLSMNKRVGVRVTMATSFLMSLVMALMLSRLMLMLSFHGLLDSLGLALVVWAGFIAPLVGATVLFEGRPTSFFFISAGHRLVELMALAAIIGLMG